LKFRARVALGAAAVLVTACAASEPRARVEFGRAGYEAFRRDTEGLLEPNYLPFMAEHLVVESQAGRLWRRLRSGVGLEPEPPEEWLVFCRWPSTRFPLAVFVEPPSISEDLLQAQAPGAARDPEDYVEAVDRALQLWEQGLEGLATFERVSRRGAADIVLRLRAAEPPAADPYIQVLGTTPLGDACRYRGGDPRSGRVEVDFRVQTLDIYVADQHGLLLADQVERIALHEIGHALGMRTHSPIPADLMYRVVRDRLPSGELGTEDVNSFLSLYRIPNGTVYRRVAPEEEPGASVDPGPPEGAPQLELAPHVDARLGYEIQLPLGWTRLETAYGVVAVDGVTWDYAASFQLNVRAYDSARGYLERYGAWHLARGRLLDSGPVEAGRHPGVRFLLEVDGDRMEEITLIEPGDGRIVVVIWDCAARDHARWEPWFRAALASLELRSPRLPAADREYEPGAPAVP
jgi:predicted Zn-dependent protease